MYLVDNGSTDSSADEISDRFPEVCVIRNINNLGFAGGNNVGIQRALEEKADYVLLLNNDTVVDPQFLSELVRAADLHPDAGILGAKIVYYDRPDILWALGGDFQQPIGRIRMFGRDKPVNSLQMKEEEFDHVPGAVMLVRAEVFKKVGLLDLDFFLTWEDVELCLRAQKAGWKIMAVPSSVVSHKVSRATAGKLAMYFSQRNRLLFTSKYLPWWQFGMIVIPFHFVRLLALLVIELLRRRVDLAGAAVLGTLDFFRGRLGKGSMALIQKL